MSFLNGRVSYSRLRVSGASPQGAPFEVINVDFLATLKKHAFKPSPTPRIGVLETGFTTGIHLLDKAFSEEKNAFGQCAHFAIRVDSHQISGDLKKALRLVNEHAAAKGAASGFASRADKQDAKETANAEIERELATGKYRKSKMVPVMWDLEKHIIYTPASGAVIEELAKLMREAFSVNLEIMSAGPLATEIVMAAKGPLKVLADLRPSAFTNPPTGGTNYGETNDGKIDKSLPGIPWVAKAYDLNDYLGNEFLMWLLWYSLEGPISTTKNYGVGDTSVILWKALDLECAWGITGKTALRMGADADGNGSPLQTPECRKALAAGKWPRKMGMLLSNDEHAFEVVLQGDHMQVNGLVLPAIDGADSERELQDACIHLIRAFNDTLEATYAAFLRVRLSSKWPEIVASISNLLTAK